MNSSLKENTYTSFDSDQFGYLQWKNSDTPDTVLIAVHGINGAAQDFEGLGSYLTKNLPSSAIYAAETRGQGNDPNKARRGDIYRAEEWYKDLHTFTMLIKKSHPEAKIIWCGESMGSLIVTHAYASYTGRSSPPCSAMLLLAPVVNLSHKIPAWKFHTANLIAFLFPSFKVSLTTLTDQDAVKVTQGSESHQEQAATNSYFIPKFSLRLLAALGKHIREMHQKSSLLKHPILVINGGKDYFTPPRYVETFLAAIPDSTASSHRYYPEAYHLLMYDDQRESIFEDILIWTRSLT